MPVRIDPVCGRRVDQSAAGVQALLSSYAGKLRYFCSMACKQEFSRNPRAYAVVIDRMCGKELDREEVELQGLCLDHEGQRYWFCSVECKQRFSLAPGFYGPMVAADESGRQAVSGEQRPGG